jgi:Zn-dependent peptidase ImmA (M78 family)
LKNPIIKDSVKRRIDSSVARMLKDVGAEWPPLDLSEVRRKLELDLQYYSSSDPSHLRQLTHTLKIAGEEFLRKSRPVSWIVEKFGLKGFLFWDLNEIHIDQDLHDLKLRWAESHEIGHRLCGWHKHYLLGDRKSELNPMCHAKIEAEANYASGQLLFLKDRFVEQLMSKQLDFQHLKNLSTSFGNTMTTTLWRLVEEYRGPEAVVGIVSGHPHHRDEGFDALHPCKNVIESPGFRERFSDTTEVELFVKLQEACNWKRGGMISEKEVEMVDNNGESHTFVFESLCTQPKDKNNPDGPRPFNVLTLAIQQKRISTIFTPGQVEAVQASIAKESN